MNIESKYLNLDGIAEDCYLIHRDNDPLKFLIDPLNQDLGGTLSYMFFEIELTQIQYEIIKLKTYNKIMEMKKWNGIEGQKKIQK